MSGRRIPACRRRHAGSTPSTARGLRTREAPENIAVCTLILLLRQVPGWPIVIGSNRDEHFARPAAPPALFASEGERFVAPQDLQAGGTWMGVNARGIFVGVTNRRSASEPPATVRSRGALVRELLTL